MNFARLARDLRQDEGLSLRPYQDHLGYWTIGVGNRFILGEEVTKNTPPLKSEAQAMELFYSDIYQALLDAHEWYPDLHLLREDRAEVVAQMAFQLGLTKLRQFVGTRRALAAGDYQAVARHMRNSLWYKQTTNRAERLARIMENPLPRA
jgi:lysozyme